MARRLREARRESGLSTRAVAERLPRRNAVSHATVASYENGVTVPPIDILAALVHLYQRPLNWFLETRETLGGFRYRNLKSRVPLSLQRQYEATAGKWADAYRNLDSFLKCDHRKHLVVIDANEHLLPEDLAKAVRGRLNLDDSDPIQSMVEVLESFSARALELKATFGIDGAAARYGDDLVVLLNPAVANERVRMNAAHELAYLLYDDCKSELNWTDAEVEKRAYIFATSVLLPPTQLREAFQGKSFLRLLRYKEKFGVSLIAMIYLAEKQGIINSTTARWLWSEVAKKGWRQHEPGHVWRDRAIAFEMMLESAIQTKRISWPEAERITGITERDLQQRLTDVMKVRHEVSPDLFEPNTIKFTEEHKVTEDKTAREKG